MREILFRGKRFKNGEWVYGGLVHPPEMKVAIFYQDRPGILGKAYVDPETVGQYVGQRDRNGTLVFEGDIVEYAMVDNDEVYGEEVVFKESSFTLDTCLREGMSSPDFSEYVVLGNKWDNPELLEEQSDD